MILPVINAASFFLQIYNALPIGISNLVTVSWVFGAVVFMVHLFTKG